MEAYNDYENQELNIKVMRSDVSHVFLWLFLYNLLFVIFPLFNLSGDWGLISIAAVAAGNIMLLLVALSKKHRIRYGTPDREKMTPVAFITLVCMLCLAQCISGGFTFLWDAIGLEGTSIPFEIDSIWVIIYAAAAGPIAEELSYRGFGKKGLEGLGVVPAIIISSYAFGLMHGNLSQFVFAVLVGLVMGYYCSKYGLVWTIIIHIFNNFVLATLPTILPGYMSEVASGIADIFVFICAAAGIVLLFLKRRTIADFLHDPKNRPMKGWLKAVLSSAWFWIFSIIYIGMMVVLIAVPELQALMTTPSV